ncbi:MAG: peptidoglycan-binding domain-containing protein [Candidatus Staskawiczbacteria bacterium]|nr:peptidoglycan-binding domain-containing protein [Candidatus Staskawiczbacteria bacterium]
MSIKTKILSIVLGLSLVVMLVPAGASAAALTSAQISAIISLLQSFGADATTVANVTASLNGTAPVTPPANAGTGTCSGVSFTRNLTTGSIGADVKCLQSLLNTSAATQVALTGAGSPGHETTYFGPATLAAVKKYQAANGMTPANQVGPMTRAALNAALGTTGGNTGGVIIPTGAGLAVQLASDNPAPGVLVSGSTSISATPSQAAADLAHYTFVNGDNAPVKVTNLKVTRTGVAADATLESVYLYNGAHRLTDAASVSSGLITFNDPTGLFTVPAGGSITIKVVSDIALGSAGQTVGVAIKASTDVTTNASSVRGTFPLAGNVDMIASATLANVNFAGAAPTPVSGAVDPQNDYVIWQNSLTVNTRAVTFNRLALYQLGSASATDIVNYRLNIDGVNVGSAVAQADANGYITFDLSSAPVALQTGTRVVKVLANIVNGSSKTFAYAVRVSADAVFVDSQIGVGTVPTVTDSSIAFTQRKSCATTACSINSGTVTFAKRTDSPSGTVVLGAPGATLAKYDVSAAGEPVKISSLFVGIVDSTTAGVANFRNVTLYANGVQIGTTQTVTEGDVTTGKEFTLGSSLIVNPGSPVILEIRSDIKEYSGTTPDIVTNGDAIYATIIKGSSNAEAQVSKSAVSTPSANVNGNTLTIGQGALTLSKYTAYTSQSAVLPVSNYKLGDFTLTANTTEAVNINDIEVTLNYVSGDTTNLYVKATKPDGSTLITPVKATVSTLTPTWAVNYQILPGQTWDMSIYGNVGTAAGSTSAVATTGLYVSGITANSSQTVTGGTINVSTTGQTITWTSGTFTPTFANVPSSIEIVPGGAPILAGRYKFTAQNDSYTLTALQFSVPSISSNVGESGIINSAELRDGSTVLATQAFAFPSGTTTPTNDTAYFVLPNGGIPIAAGSTKYIDLYYNLGNPVIVSTAANCTDLQTVTPTLTYVEALNSTGAVKGGGTKYGNLTSATGITIATTNGTAGLGNAIAVVKSQPTLTQHAIAGTNSSGDQEIYNFTVAAGNQGPITLKQLKFNISVTKNAGTPALNTFKLYEDGVPLTMAADNTGSTGVAISDGLGYSIVSTATSVTATATGTVTLPVYVQFLTEKEIGQGSSHTYSLHATLSGFSQSSGAKDSVVTQLANDTTASLNYAIASSKRFMDQMSGTYLYSLHTATGGSGSGTVYSVIWSDEGSASHSDSVTAGTGDYLNGYLLPGSPLGTSVIYAN